MSISHRTNRLKLIGSPSVEKLQNGRYKLVVTCSTMNSREDWYSANKARIFPDFGSLQSAEMSIDGLAPRTGEAYADMRLTQVESGNRSGMGQVGDYNVSLTYETLGSSFIQVKDDNTDYELNGLRRVTRTSIAEAGTDYAKTVGTSFIDHQIDAETAVRCFLASYGIDDTDSFRQVQEVYVEAGTLSETLDNVGSQKAKVIETIGTDPSTPSGYSLASKQESDFEGFQTNRFTFLKPSILSLQQDFNNGLKQVSVQAFSMTANGVSAELAVITTGHELISQNESDYEGIKTSTFQYQIDESITEDYELNGLKSLSITELSSTNFTARDIGVVGPSNTPQVDLYLSAQDIDNGGVIKVRESVWVESGTLSVSTSNLSEGVQQVETTFLVIKGTTVGPIIREETRNFDGLQTISVTTLQDKTGASIIGTGENLVNRYDRLVDFTYPGVVRLREDVITSTEGVDPILFNFELFTPVQSKVTGTVSVIFQSSSDIVAADFIYNDGQAGGPAGGFWNPTEWARTYVSGIGWRYSPFSVSQAMRGYRTDIDISGISSLTPSGENSFVSNGVAVFVAAGTSYVDPVNSGTDPDLFARINGVADANGFLFTIDGRRIYGGTPFIMQVSGGPEDPSGNKYVLDVDLRPAFEDINGNQYYKKTIITATA